MYTILCVGVTFLVTSLLALYSPGILRRTIGDGIDADFLSLVKLSWNNPFSKKSILEYADAFVALQADRILPAVLPGATSIGRPYIFEKEKACFLNLTMANNTGNPFMDVANPSNLTGLMDSGNLDGIPPMERVILSGVWYGYLVVFFLLLLALAFVAVSNCSFRTAAARIDACVSSLVAVTGGDDPDKSKLLREFARQQGLLIDPYNLGLMAHVDFIIGEIDRADTASKHYSQALLSITSLTQQLKHLSRTRNASTNDNQNLRQALVVYQERHEELTRELNYLESFLGKPTSQAANAHDAGDMDVITYATKPDSEALITVPLSGYDGDDTATCAESTPQMEAAASRQSSSSSKLLLSGSPVIAGGVTVSQTYSWWEDQHRQMQRQRPVAGKGTGISDSVGDFELADTQSELGPNPVNSQPKGPDVGILGTEDDLDDSSSSESEGPSDGAGGVGALEKKPKGPNHRKRRRRPKAKVHRSEEALQALSPEEAEAERAQDERRTERNRRKNAKKMEKKRRAKAALSGHEVHSEPDLEGLSTVSETSATPTPGSAVPSVQGQEPPAPATTPASAPAPFQQPQPSSCSGSADVPRSQGRQQSGRGSARGRQGGDQRPPGQGYGELYPWMIEYAKEREAREAEKERVERERRAKMEAEYARERLEAAKTNAASSHSAEQSSTKPPAETDPTPSTPTSTPGPSVPSTSHPEQKMASSTPGAAPPSTSGHASFKGTGAASARSYVRPTSGSANDSAVPEHTQPFVQPIPGGRVSGGQQRPTPAPATTNPTTPQTPLREDPGAAAARSYSHSTRGTNQGSSAPETTEPFVQPIPGGRNGP
ncbi:MAG: hypothetical protein LQ341_001809, partial [Variospora aurantia]